MPKLRFFLSLCVLKLVLICSAQQSGELKITGQYTNQSADQILSDIENRYDLDFYLIKAELPDHNFTITATDQPLGQFLTRILEGTGLGFMIYRDYAVVIADAGQLSQFYAPTFFKALEDKITGIEDADAGIPVFEVGSVDNINPSGVAKIRGVVVDSELNEPIIGSTIFFPELDKGTATDFDGSFEIELPVGKHEATVSFIGYNSLSSFISVFNDGELEINLTKVAIALDEVVVEAAAADANVSSAEIGVTRLKVDEIRKLPTFMGEVDVVKSLLLQPGVSSTGEGASGFNVRGGNVDQNLVLMDEQFLFNTSHALGFFSAFNADLISNVTLYKGHIPAQYGGRLASVLDIKVKDGHPEQYIIKGGLGLVASRLSVQGPLVKDKSSFILGGRATYSDWILKRIKVPEVENSSASFYDVNLRLTHRFNDKNQIIISAYSTKDENVFNDEFGFNYSTNGGQLSYKKIINSNLISTTSLTVSRYDATGLELKDSVTSAQLFTRDDYLKFKELITYSPGNDLNLTTGLSSIFYRIEPGERNPRGPISLVIPKTLETEQALESAIFINAEYNFNSRLSGSAGLRYVNYNFLGPKNVFQYQNPDEPSVETITSQTAITKGEIIKTYHSIEPRLALRYLLQENTSIKFGYSRSAQFLNQLANLVTPTPVSIWQLSNSYIEPQRAHSTSLGLFKNFRDNLWETSVEAYYRYLDKALDYKDFARLTANEHIETELLTGIGRTYGLELGIKKKEGTLHGQLAYTYSRAQAKTPGINRGNWYRANYDKPHELALVLNWQPNRRNTFVINFNYATGRPITAPVSRYTLAGQYNVLEYSVRNSLRIPDYHRLDIAYTIDRGYNKSKKIRSSWTVSIYNVYGRRNAYSVFFEPTQNAPRTFRLSVLGSAFFSLSLNLFFQ